MKKAQDWLSGIEDLVNGMNIRPSWDEYFMAIAMLMSARSNCSRLNVGCVLVSGGENKNRIIAAGYNGFLPGSPHVSKIKDGHEQATVHAEQNAVADAARRGVMTNGASAYITHFPCVYCAKLLLSAGIKKALFRFDYRNEDIVYELFNDAGVSIEKL